MLKKLILKFERICMAIPYATVLEHETALEIAGDSPSQQLSLRQIFQKIETHFAACAFAFCGCHEAALTFVSDEPNLIPMSVKQPQPKAGFAKILFSRQPAT